MLVKCSGALIDRPTAICLIVLVLRERLVLAEKFLSAINCLPNSDPHLSTFFDVGVSICFGFMLYLFFRFITCFLV